jgi:hypothetical protein
MDGMVVGGAGSGYNPEGTGDIVASHLGRVVTCS